MRNFHGIDGLKGFKNNSKWPGGSSLIPQNLSFVGGAAVIVLMPSILSRSSSSEARASAANSWKAGFVNGVAC